MSLICCLFLLINPIQDTTKVDVSKALNKKKEVKLSSKISMGYYTAALLKNPNSYYWGWINYGDNLGRQEVATKEEWYRLWEKYMER